MAVGRNVLRRFMMQQRKLSESKARKARRHLTKNLAKSTTPQKTQRKTLAEKAEAAKKRRERRVAYNNGLSKARDVVMEQANRLMEEFGGHSAERYFEEIIPQACITKSARKPLRWNAFLRDEVKSINGAGEPRKKSSELMSQISTTTSKDEQIAATEDSQKEMDAQSLPKVPAFHHDVDATIAAITSELKALHARTGTEIAMFAVRSKFEHKSSPEVFYTSDRIPEFFQLSIGHTVQDIAARMEAYCLSGVQGVRNNINTALALKKRTRALILDKLREVTGSTTTKMYYQNFDDNITAKWGVVIRNWPLSRLCSPSDVPSRHDIRLLHTSWESGKTYFQKLTEDEFQEWENHRFRNTLARMGAGDGDGDATMNAEPIPVPQAAFALSTPAPQPTSVPSTGTAQAAQHEMSQTIDSTPSIPTDRDSSISTSTCTLPVLAETVFQSGSVSYRTFINSVTAPDGSGIQVTTKPRKVRSDKGKKRASLSKDNTNPSPSGSASDPVSNYTFVQFP